MDKFIITGGKPLHGTVTVAGAKNVALKIPIAALLTGDKLVVKNVPQIRDVLYLVETLRSLGANIELREQTLEITTKGLDSTAVPLEFGARLRSSSLVLGPLLARWGEAKVPNPGGCRLGARPIDRHIEALRQMGAEITYNSTDGYFYAKAKKLRGATINFPKNTHTGTETILLAAVLAQGRTVMENAAQEVEVDDLINCLNQMGAKIQRVAPRRIVIEGVKALHGLEYTIMPDRNEEITFAIAAAVTGGEIIVKDSQPQNLTAFLKSFKEAGGTIKVIDAQTTCYGAGHRLVATQITTAPHPGFMTDWQGPWAVFMTQANGRSTIHESVFESRFSYVRELRKMGAKIEFFDPPVKNPEQFYNFNWNDRVRGSQQGIIINGPTALHNAIVTIDDLRAGATLVLAALTAPGASYVYGVEQIDRGYEKIEARLVSLGASILRVKEGSA